ncbi:hypothetical protein acdb102_17860 [Acidothermaceae bacterium B102]|nr:hypothetical protein acdb102_17860 [Acidothermaceae bacterium B102]
MRSQGVAAMLTITWGSSGKQRRTRNYLIRNQTPRELVLLGRTDEDGRTLALRLAPLQRRLIGGHPVKLFDAAASYAQLDHAIDWECEPSRSARMLTMAWLAGAGFAGAAAGMLGWQVAGVGWFGFGGLVWLTLCLVALPIAAGSVRQQEDASVHSTEMDPTPVRGDGWELVRDLAISIVQGMVGVLLILVALGVPALAIYYGTEVQNVITLRHWNHWQLTGGARNQYILVARGLQLVLLIVMSVLPALMFFQFDREKLSTLIDRWLHAVFRLDPSLQTVVDVDAKYGRRVEEFLGATLSVGADAPRRRLRNRTPVVVTTILIAIGWIVILVNTADPSATKPPAGGETATSFQSLFVPNATPLTMAFLGAYFLCVQVALRGYIRGDLKPKTYNVLTVRILMAVILAWALQALAGTHPWTLAFSFLAGVTPNTILLQIRSIGVLDQLKGQFAKDGLPADGSDELASKSPLTLLDEIDVYERTRLEEEGITCVQALARHDLADLMLSSRIPAPRLIDWVDQAVLYQHVAPKVQALHGLGVRSATDFLQLCALIQDTSDPATARLITTELKKALGGVHPMVLHAVLEDDEWLAYVRNWRAHDGSKPGPITVYDTSGRATERTRDQVVHSPSTYELTHPEVAPPPPANVDLTVVPAIGAQQG